MVIFSLRHARMHTGTSRALTQGARTLKKWKERKKRKSTQHFNLTPTWP